MVTLEKIACLALGSSFDSLGAPLKAASCETSSETGREICHDDLSRLAALGMGTKYDVCASPILQRSQESATPSLPMAGA